MLIKCKYGRDNNSLPLGGADPYTVLLRLNGGPAIWTDVFTGSTSGTINHSDEIAIKKGDLLAMFTNRGTRNNDPNVISRIRSPYEKSLRTNAFYSVGPFPQNPIELTISILGTKGGAPTYLEELHKLDRTSSSHYIPR